MLNFFRKISAWITGIKNATITSYFDFRAYLNRTFILAKQFFKQPYFYNPKAYWWMLAIYLCYEILHIWLWKKFDLLIIPFVANLEFSPLNLWQLIIYSILLLSPAVFYIKDLAKYGYKLRIFNVYIICFIVMLYWLQRKHYIQNDLYQDKIHHWTIIQLYTAGKWQIPAGPMVAALLGKGIIGIFDPLFAVFSIYAVLLVGNLFRFGLYSKGGTILSQDLPIEELSQDRFGRSSYFNPLILELRQAVFDSRKAFAVGINSTWGYGKTSLLEIMKKAFEREEKTTVFMEYNPWMSTMKSGLTMDFFTQLEETLARHIETDNLILKYGRALSRIDSDKNPLKKISGLFDSDLPLKERHDLVSELLLKTNKRFVVVIDDIDRLDNGEVFEVLRLIRNTANFGRVVFVAAYDKNYLTYALSQNHIHNPKKYLEKIFDLELSLPKIGVSMLQQLILSAFVEGTNNFAVTDDEKLKIRGLFNDMIYATITSTDRKINAVSSQIWSILKNKRDIIRFTNAVLLTYRINQKWVYLPDLVILELIKILDNNLFTELSVAENYLETSSNGSVRVYKLFAGSPSMGPAIARMAGLATMRHDILQGKDEIVKTLINALFENALSIHYQQENALKTIENFENYFIYAQNSVSNANIASIINIP